MKKVLFFILFFFSVSYASASNFGTPTLNYTTSPAISNCNKSASDTISTHYAVPTSTGSNVAVSGTWGCTTNAYYTSSEYALPSSTTYKAKDISLSCGYQERVSKIDYYNGGIVTTISVDDIPSSGYAGTFTQYRIWCQKYDNDIPLPSDITVSTPTNILAFYNYSYQINGNVTSGSPIKVIGGFRENYSTASVSDSFTMTGTIISSTASSFSSPWNIKNVDLPSGERQSNGAREYTLSIKNICDEAGNCWSGTDNHNHNVYANTNYITTKTATSELDDYLVADGDDRYLNIILADTYGNSIIKATGIDRKVNITFYGVENSMYLDQYLREKGDGKTSVFSTITNGNTSGDFFPIGTTTTKIFSDLSSLNGVYTYGFKFYTPTQESGFVSSDADSKFNINSITYNITNSNFSWNDSSTISNSNISAKFNPLYYTDITGGLGEGLIEGSTQTGNINVIHNSNSGETPSVSLNVEYGSGLKNVLHPLLNMKYGTTSTNMIAFNGEGNGKSELFGNGTGLHPIFTKISKQNAGQPLPKNPLDYFSTHLAYTLDGKNIRINSTVVGKLSYWGNSFNSAGLAYVKILGQTYNKGKYSETIEGQAGTDVKMLNGTITKSSLKTKMRSNAYNFIKNVKTPDYTWISPQILDLGNFNNSTNKDNGGVSLSSGTVLYYGGLPSGKKNVVLDSSSKVKGKKTIIISGGNLYIKNDILLNNKSTDILGIIVLKDSKGNYGNVYIDPGVTQIHANIYTDKSLISYNGTIEFDGLNTISSQLKNQLYIYGSVFSENTIGGSRASTPICPYYVQKSICTDEEAQKYDLNFLRRYYLKDTDNDGIGDTPAGGPSTKKVFSFGSNLFSYPLIIEYNPKIQTTPPPLFTY